MRRPVTLVAATVGVLAVAVPAWAYYALTSNTVQRAYTAATLSAAVTPAATASSATAVAVSWSLPASQVPGASYVVTRTTDSLAVCTVAATVTSCADPNAVAPGTTYSYAVKTTLPGTSWETPATAFQTTTPHVYAIDTIATQTAGTPFTVTVKAMKGSPLAVDTAYIGSKSVTFTGPAASPGGNAASINGVAPGTAANVTFVLGSATVPATLTKKDTAATITATTGSGAMAVAGTSNAFAVNAGTGTRLAFTSVTGLGTVDCLLGCTVAGLGSNPSVSSKVSVVDAYGNTAANLGSALSFTVTKTSGGTLSNAALTIPATGTAESGTAFTFTAGTANYSTTITAPTTGGKTQVQMSLSKN